MIKIVTIVGASGAMGANIAGIFASFGNAKVNLISRTIEKSSKAKERAIASVRAQSIEDNLLVFDYSDLERCCAESDLIFESLAENFETKNEYNLKISKAAKAGAYICTGTSGLSTTELAQAFTEDQQTRYMGLHFFNPPYNLNLCEIIPSKHTSDASVDFICSYASNMLRRSVVLIKDTPAFLGNRVGFQFINEVMQYAVKYQDKGGIDYIDAIIGAYTGRSMAPLRTADFVGLDIHKAIVDNIYEKSNDYVHDTFKLPEFAQLLIDRGELGKKTGKGLYGVKVNEDGSKEYLVYDIKSDSYRAINNYNFPFKNKMIAHLKCGDYKKAFAELLNDDTDESKLCLKLLLKSIIYGLYTAKNVAYEISYVDVAMAAGYSWVPPIALVEALGGGTYVKGLVKEHLNYDDELTNVLDDLPKSSYDYRRYMRAAR